LTATTCPLFSDLWSYTYNAANRNAATIKFVTASPLANTLPLNCRERAAVSQKYHHISVMASPVTCNVSVDPVVNRTAADRNTATIKLRDRTTIRPLHLRNSQ